MNKPDWKISASCISAFKACPTRFQLAYREGLRVIEATESQRVGTNWHTCQEITQLQVEEPCQCFARSTDQLADPDCPLCEGAGHIIESDPLKRVTAWLNYHYQTVPPNMDREAWETERVILAYSIAGWLWYYQNDNLNTVATELRFELPLRNPATGRALPNVSLVGKIDRIVRRGGQPLNLEAKSTTKSLASDSSFWDRLNLDTQLSLYAKASRILQQTGKLPGLLPDDPLVAGSLYDAWHRPGIRPKKLTQAESKAFMESGEYCGQQFEIIRYWGGDVGAKFEEADIQAILVEGTKADILPGATPKPTKKNPNPTTPFAIRETPEMFGARLLADIYADPGKYFVRREIPRTDQDLEAFDWELYHIYQSMRQMERYGHWFKCEGQCEATFRCAYTPLCYHKMAVCDGKTTPPGFRRIFDLETTVTEEA